MADLHAIVHKFSTAPWLQAHPTARLIVFGLLAGVLLPGLAEVLHEFYLFARHVYSLVRVALTGNSQRRVCSCGECDRPHSLVAIIPAILVLIGSVAGGIALIYLFVVLVGGPLRLKGS
jgi:hypothetical protein